MICDRKQHQREGLLLVALPDLHAAVAYFAGKPLKLTEHVAPSALEMATALALTMALAEI